MRSLILAGCLILAAPSALAQSTSEETDGAVVISQKGLDAWDAIYNVFSHPRCANCHTDDEHPRWSGPSYEGLPQSANNFHRMNVKRGADGFGADGLKCQTCHQESNSATLHGPPGAPHWHLAPTNMAWWQKSSAHVCAQIKDPTRNGGRSLQDVARHIQTDPLVAWGWAPGPGREKAPGSAQETFDLLQTWIAEQAPCPAGQ